MGSETKISWTDSSWNPVRGCSRVSEGCRNCYAERVAARFADPGQPYHELARRKLTIVNNDEHDPGNKREARWTGVVRMVPEHLGDPMRWKKPRRIFVNSMSDLFHEKLSDDDITDVFAVMALAPRHTFQILTKRATRMREWMTRSSRDMSVAGNVRGRAWEMLGRVGIGRVIERPDLYKHEGVMERPWPLPNVWLGVSVENQEAADERIPELLRTPAAVRFLSCEPLIGPLEFSDATRRSGAVRMLVLGQPALAGIDWVIAGCESGHGARACKVEWLRSIRDQCAAAGVAYFLKQAEESTDLDPDRRLDIGDDDSISFEDGSKLKARRPGGNRIIELPYLDGVQHAAFPVTT